MVTKNANPTATITPQGPTTFCVGGNVLLQANTGLGWTYKWKKNSSYISGATSSSYNATTAGTYKVEVTNSSGCSKISPGLVVTINCKLHDEDIAEGGLEIFPNPTAGIITVKFTSEENQQYSLTITDVLGREVMNEQIFAIKGLNEQVLNLTDFHNGVYLLRLKNSESEMIQKIVRD